VNVCVLVCVCLCLYMHLCACVQLCMHIFTYLKAALKRRALHSSLQLHDLQGTKRSGAV